MGEVQFPEHRLQDTSKCCSYAMHEYSFFGHLELCCSDSILRCFECFLELSDGLHELKTSMSPSYDNVLPGIATCAYDCSPQADM